MVTWRGTICGVNVLTLPHESVLLLTIYSSILKTFGLPSSSSCIGLILSPMKINSCMKSLELYIPASASCVLLY